MFISLEACGSALISAADAHHGAMLYEGLADIFRRALRIARTGAPRRVQMLCSSHGLGVRRLMSICLDAYQGLTALG